MPKLPKIRWKTLPAGPRWLVYGVLLLVGILAGGAVTAYGGMLLVVAICKPLQRSLHRKFFI